ncbi:MAG: alpha/beta hydrolase [Actinobacteria bacterium]|nr:alpha/beta hydrolase [Actinomycetota bacterium]
MLDDVDRVNALLRRAPDVVAAIPGTGRVIAADVEGDPDGVPVLLVHGTPDSRLARHPDPSIAADAGVRLIAVDRPGFGHSSFDPSATPTTFGRDLTALFDHLGIDSAHLVAWSAGALWALGAAATIAPRVRSVTAVGGLVPFEAFGDPTVRRAAGGARLGMIETAEELGASAAAAMIAPMLVPDPATPPAALEHRAESGDAALSAVPGADIQMAAACCDAVRMGLDGLIRDVEVQLTGSLVDFAASTVPTNLLTGAHDTTCPPAFARWFGEAIPGATVEIVPDAGHGLLLTHWHQVLAHAIASPLQRSPGAASG